MARRARAEVEGGLYHVITRGNNRRQIFNSPADYEKFLSLLAVSEGSTTILSIRLLPDDQPSTPVNRETGRQLKSAVGRKQEAEGSVSISKFGVRIAEWKSNLTNPVSNQAYVTITEIRVMGNG